MPSKEKDKVIKGYCPECGMGARADIKAEYCENWDERGLWGSDTYRVLKCRGCEERIYFQIESIFSEDTTTEYDSDTGEYCELPTKNITYLPRPEIKKSPEWFGHLCCINTDLSQLVSEVYTAINMDLFVLAAMGVRTVFDFTSELLEIPAQLTFARKLQALEEKEIIGGEEKKHLEVLTDAGSAAAHRNWRPDQEQLFTLVDIMEIFLNRVLILSKSVEELRAKVPPRPSMRAARS